MGDTTYCVGCRFLRRSGSNGAWYTYRCGAVERERGRDYVTGKEGFKSTNDIGRTSVSTDPEDRFPACREVNTDGACVMYAAKAGSLL